MKDKLEEKSLETTPTDKDDVIKSEGQSVSDLDKEIKDRLKGINRDDIMKAILKRAEENGQIFDSPESANKWAERYLEKELIKDRLKMGVPVICTTCGKYGSNKKTGPLRRSLIVEGKQTYKHEHCI